MTKKVSFFLENIALFEIMWKSFVEPDRAKMKIWRMRIACWITQGTKTHSLRICNTYCFSTSTMVARKRLDVTLYVQ